jgi:chromosome segregation protein
MFLKRIDVVGFKSFADRIGIEFVPGVTAVVGPNGSGKSNISDAVRWVLGEQSAKSLRGSKMEDIIFAGSDSRKSLNVAEVTLTLDNQDAHLPIDYNEVSVTRRVYRSGESEYLLNKQQCRLKDIVDLFMDSGLGREAYSIIGQGKVEEILSSKPEERRKIFEEAAGVLKYKTRKQKAEQKLSLTEDNLLRVEDIMHELEDQVEPLEVQASIAKDYLEKKEELEQIEVALTVQEIEDLHKSWDEKSKEIELLRDQELKSSSVIQKEEAVLEQLRSKINATDESIDQLQEVLLFASEELEKLEGKKEVLKERKKNYHQNKDQLQKKIDIHKQKKIEYEDKLSDVSTKLEVQRNSLNKLKADLKENQNQLDLQEQNIEQKIEQLKSEYIEYLNEQASIKNEVRYLTNQSNDTTAKVNRLDEGYKNYIGHRKEIKDKRLKAEKEAAQSKDNLTKHIVKYNNLKTKLEKCEKAYNEKQSNLNQAFQYIQQFKSKKEVLEDMQEDYAGYFQGVKEVLKGKDQFISGIEGAVAELISVTKEFEIAIETTLGAMMQHVVVKDEMSARAAIQFLKKNRYGRATFLPLSVVRSRSMPSRDVQQIEGHPAYVGIASDLIEFNPKYTNIVQSLLGQVIIANNLEGANALASILNHRFRIVTLDGDVVNSGGSMTGGSQKQKNNSLLSRQRELDNLTEKLEKMEKQASMLENSLKDQKQEVQGIQAELEQMREQGEKLRIEEQQHISLYREIELEERNASERLTQYDREKSSLQEENAKIVERIEHLNEKLEHITKLADDLENQVNSLSEKRKTQQYSKENLQAVITELKVEVATQYEQLNNTEATFNRIQSELSENNSQLNDAEEDYWLLDKEMHSNSSGEEELDRQIVIKRKDKDQTVQLISERRKERLDSQNKTDDIERELKELKRTYKQLNDTIHREEVSVNRLDVELENRLEHLSEEYQLSYERAKEKYQLQIEVNEARKKVKLIKLSIDDLGTVNLGAIEEFERVSERFNFLKEQREDLMNAKETLYEVINEMDQEMTKRFKETFFEIQHHFKTTFSKLFGGGRADLQLTDPEQLLTTGVDILAQPPGKKLQHLALLSGGERALTAIALLFSILKVRPVPFCILDEVEAALDDANVHRFAQYLRAFSKQTQFIVVTHRKGTMEEADVLYGITMQESGVSNIVSVKLEESKELVASS